MVRARLELRHDPEVCAEEAGAELGDQLLAGALAAVLAVAAEVAVDAVRRRGPVRLMPISA